MRISITVSSLLFVALCCTSAQAQADPKRPLPADVGAGRVAWFDITTTDLPKSQEFYNQLFDWKFNPVPGTDLAVEIVADGTPVGTIRVAEGKISGFNGVIYVQVSDLPDRCAKVKELGGSVVPGFPFNLSDGRGAIGLILDPAGHPLGMYSRTSLPSKKSN